MFLGMEDLHVHAINFLEILRSQLESGLDYRDAGVGDEPGYRSQFIIDLFEGLRMSLSGLKA